jgi:hypothetical protein
MDVNAAALDRAGCRGYLPAGWWPRPAPASPLEWSSVMHEIMRERIRRKLEALPEEQLYEVVDFIEFLDAKYAPGKAPQPTGLQRFAERFEDRMRDRAVAARYISGTIGVLGRARRVMDRVIDAGREAAEEFESSLSRRAAAEPRPAAPAGPRQLPAPRSTSARTTTDHAADAP